ncbi:Gfo/Idh/MocA family oxidoreductase [Mesorhizobium sp. M1312]|uniref:Gfo/Idh/MocA family protein n=1 Tax=unclassified Mesorhizobium TaxID=325217 RepID=UPI00333BEFC0
MGDQKFGHAEDGQNDMTAWAGPRDANAPIRVGIAGAGLWAERAHVPSLSRLADVRIVGIADPDLARAKFLAARASDCAVHHDVETMLSAGLDAIVIATPEDTHYTVAKAALQAGIHVLCEKPMSRTVGEARELAEIASKAQVVTKLGFVLRYSPAMRQLKTLLQNGYVGTVHSFVFFNNSPQFFDKAEPFHWVMDAERTGGGAFVEYGCHGLDLGRWLVGEMSEVCANAVRMVDERPDPATGALRTVTVDDTCSWLVKFAGGAEGQFHVSWSSLVNFGFQVAVIGDMGVLGWRMTRNWPFAEVLGNNDQASDFKPFDISEKYLRGIEWATTWRECFAGCLARRFVDEIRGIASPEGPDFSDGLRNQIAIEAIARSLKDRCWASIDDK